MGWRDATAATDDIGAAFGPFSREAKIGVGRYVLAKLVDIFVRRLIILIYQRKGVAIGANHRPGGAVLPRKGLEFRS